MLSDGTKGGEAKDERKAGLKSKEKPTLGASCNARKLNIAEAEKSMLDEARCCNKSDASPLEATRALNLVLSSGVHETPAGATAVFEERVYLSSIAPEIAESGRSNKEIFKMSLLSTL